MLLWIGVSERTVFLEPKVGKRRGSVRFESPLADIKEAYDRASLPRVSNLSRARYICIALDPDRVPCTLT
jgi:hypothetical protein